MPRAPRLQDAGYVHHVICRGNDRQILFKSSKDYNTYIALLESSRKLFPVKIYNYILMENHIHLLLEPKEDGSLSKFMEFVSKGYAKYFNKEYDRVGHVFQGRFKSFIVQEDRYFFACMRYIDLNPVKANIVTDPEKCEWSGYSMLALGKVSKLKLDFHGLYDDLGSSAIERQISYKALVLNSQEDELNLFDRRAGILGDTEFKNVVKSKR